MTNYIEKTDRRIGRTKQSIRKAFLSLLHEKDITQITVKELSELANINRKTFYVYYDNIHDILDKLEDEIIEKILAVLEDFDFFAQDFNIYSFFKGLNNVISEDFELYQCIVYANSHTQIFIKIKDIIKASFLEKYDDSFPVSREKFHYYIEYTASGIMSVYIDWITRKSDLSLEELAETVGDITSHGLNLLRQ